jgi:hypothetical protein
MAYTWNYGEDLSITKNHFLTQLGTMVKQDVFNYFRVKTIEEITSDMMEEVLYFEKTLDMDHPLRLGFYVLFNEWELYRINSLNHISV